MSDGHGRKQTNTFYSSEQVGNALRNAGIRVAGEIDTHFLVYCEYHTNHNTPAAEVDKETGQFFCFSCRSTTDLPHLLMTRGYTYFQAIRLIGENNSDIVADVERLLKVDVVEPFDQAVIDQLHANVDPRGREYFHSRNINDDSIEFFKLGYSSKQDMVTVPVHSSDGTPLGFVGRSCVGKSFKNNRGLKKKLLLFNMHNVWHTNSHVYVVESSFDAIRLWQVGIPAVATLGSGISKQQIEMLNKSFDYITLIRDDDDAGVLMADKMDRYCHGFNSMTAGSHDVGDLSDDELTRLFGHATLLS